MSSAAGMLLLNSFDAMTSLHNIELECLCCGISQKSRVIYLPHNNEIVLNINEVVICSWYML